jgi:hypothetical protein
MSDIQDINVGAALVSGNATLVWSAFGISGVTRTVGAPVGSYDVALVNAVSASEYTFDAQPRGQFSMDALCVVEFVTPLLLRVRTRINGSPADCDFTLDVDRKRQGVSVIPAAVPAAAPPAGGASSTNETIFASPAGSDANDGSTALTPVLTLERALDLVSASSRRYSRIQLAAGQYAYNRGATYGGSPFGGLASPLAILGGYDTILGPLVVTARNDVDPGPFLISDVQAGGILITPSAAAGSLSAVAAGIQTYTDAALIGLLAPIAADLALNRTVMWLVALSATAANNGTFAITGVNDATGAVSYRNPQGVLDAAANIYGQRAFDGAILRFTSGPNAGVSRVIRDQGVAAQGSATMVNAVDFATNVFPVALETWTVSDGFNPAVVFRFRKSALDGWGAVLPTDIDMVNDVPLAPAIAAIAVGVLNAQLPTAFAVRAFASGGNPQVRLRNMRLGGFAIPAMSDTVVNAGFVLAQFGSGSEVSDNRPGFGAPLNTFRLNQPFTAAPAPGDTFVIERPNVVINYGATNTAILWSGGITGFEGVKWNNAGAVPGMVFFRYKNNAQIYESGVEFALNGGTVFLEDESILSCAFAEQINLWANAGVANPFGTAPTGISPATGRFAHDGNTLVSTGAMAAGFWCYRNGFVDARYPESTIDFVFFDGKRSALQTTTGGGFILHIANNAYHGRIDGQFAVSATAGLLQATGTGGKINAQQIELLNSGGHGLACGLSADCQAARINGLFNAGVGVRAQNLGRVARVLALNFTVAGTAGDIQAGLRPARTYTSLTTVPPIDNEYDFGGDGSCISSLGPLVGPIRTIVSGSFSIPAASTVTLATFTRNAGERLSAFGYVTDNVAGAAFQESRELAVPSDEVSYWFERTAIANQVLLRARNEEALLARVLEWAVMGFTP